MKNIVEEKGIIAIMRGIPMDQLVDVAQAVYDGGIRMIECAINQKSEDPCKEQTEILKILTEKFGDKMLIGSGTVLNVEQAEATFNAGGRLMVTPTTNPDVIKYGVDHDMVMTIGAITPTEIEKAHTSGATYVKVFPAGNFGPEYIKAVKAPLSHIKLLAVGGITLDNMVDFMKAGACGFGIGSPLLPKKAIENKDYAAITELARKYVTLFEENK